MKPIKFDIHKPIYGKFVGLQASRVETAIREGRMLEITIPQGTGIHDPVEWKRTGKVMSKVFLIEDSPMKMYGNNVVVGQKPKKSYKQKKQEKQQQLLDKYNSLDEKAQWEWRNNH
jgi:hypothetical protein